MKLLLDEQMPKSIAEEFPASIEIHTVQSQGWAGVTNGALLKLVYKMGLQHLYQLTKILHRNTMNNSCRFQLLSSR